MKFAVMPILVALLGGVSSSRFAADYCADSMKCVDAAGQPMEHLLCKFKHQSSAGKCTDIRGRMTPEERMHIQAYHNLHRNEFGMDPSWVKYPPAPEDQKFARREPDCWLQGFWGALCIRQISWSYTNEKAAQIWAEQCAEDNETYNCITDFAEEFPQVMSVHTMDGVVDGETAMFDAFDTWRRTNLTMKGDRKQPAVDRYSSAVYDSNNLGDLRFNASSEWLPWASMTFWRTFIIGCGKAHFRRENQDKTRIVCVYGPGVSYVDVLRRKNVERGGALYVKPNNGTGVNATRQCRDGSDGDPVRYPIDTFRNSCPVQCECRGYNNPSFSKGNRYINYNESAWPWLCFHDFQRLDFYPMPIPSVMDFIRASQPVIG